MLSRYEEGILTEIKRKQSWFSDIRMEGLVCVFILSAGAFRIPELATPSIWADSKARPARR